METKRTPEEKFVTLYDTAKKCLLILNHLYQKIEEGSAAAEDGTRVDQDSGIVIELYISVLSKGTGLTKLNNSCLLLSVRHSSFSKSLKLLTQKLPNDEPCCYIATGATVLQGATLRSGAVVAVGSLVHAMAVVPSEYFIPPNTIAIGDPIFIKELYWQAIC